MISAGIPKLRRSGPSPAAGPAAAGVDGLEALGDLDLTTLQERFSVVFAFSEQRRLPLLFDVNRAIAREVESRGKLRVIPDESSYVAVSSAIGRCVKVEEQTEKIVCISRAGGPLSVKWLIVFEAYSSEGRPRVKVTCIDQNDKREKNTLYIKLDLDPEKIPMLARGVVDRIFGKGASAASSGPDVAVSQFDADGLISDTPDFIEAKPAVEAPPLPDLGLVSLSPDEPSADFVLPTGDPAGSAPTAVASASPSASEAPKPDLIPKPAPIKPVPPAFIKPVYTLDDLLASTKRHWKPISLFGGSALFITAAGFFGKAANSYEDQSHSETKRMNAFAQYDTARDYSIATNVTWGMAALAAGAAVFFMVKGNAATSADASPPTK